MQSLCVISTQMSFMMRWDFVNYTLWFILDGTLNKFNV